MSSTWWDDGDEDVGAGRAMPSREALAGIRMLLTDVDGVLTNGHVFFDGQGHELKTFHVHDGAGIVYWNRAGGLSGFLSGRKSKVVRERAEELGVHEVHLGKLDKQITFAEMLERHGLQPADVAYVGDDLLDLVILRQVGFAVTVPQGRREVKAAVHHVTRTPAGEGAVREVVEILLRARGAWDAVVERGGLP